MMIIDEHAERKLITALEQMRIDPANNNILHFRFSETGGNIPALQNAAMQAAKQHLSLSSLQIYLCEDGDVYLIAPSIGDKAAHEVMVEIGKMIGADRVTQIGGLYLADTHANRILMELKKKIEQRHALQEYVKRQQQEQETQRKRAEILNTSAFPTASADLNSVRGQRSAPELMVIEDDAFSRRLLENVLGRQYHLTALAEADLALSTYQKIAPNILFLDINLPNVTGHELLERILAIDPQAYVVMISGNADRDNIMQAMSKGAKGFIAKPFNREKLFQYIDRCPSMAPLSV